MIFRRGWVSGKQCSVSEDCFLLIHCRRKITRLQSSRPAPTTFVGNINRNFRKNTSYICLTHHRFVAQFVKHKCHFISVVLQTVQHCLTHCETKNKNHLTIQTDKQGLLPAERPLLHFLNLYPVPYYHPVVLYSP